MSAAAATNSDRAWFCIRSQPKREHIAAANLKRIEGLEIFNPRLRSRKVTRRGPVWFTESLFPNYFFARFIFNLMLEDVKFTPGVSHVVRFGGLYPMIPENIIEELKRHFGTEDLQLSPEIPQQGDKVTITGHALHGMEAVVLRVMPAKQRIQVLIDMLGRFSTMDLSLASVVAERRPLPRSLFSGAVAAI